MTDTPGSNLICNGALILHGDVGVSDWAGVEGFSASDVVFALAQIGPGTDVVVRINSGGGNAFEGLAIHAILSAHQGKVTTMVEGIAASAASIIFMAGAERIVAPGSMLMIHDPAGLTIGTADDHDDTAEMLRTLGGSAASIYAMATGRPPADILAEMKAETWLSADDALGSKYATKIGTAPATATMSAAFPYAAYPKAPGQLVALASAKGWSNRAFTAAHAAGRAKPAAGQAQTATQIIDMTALVRRTHPGIPDNYAATMISENKTPDQARAALFERMAEQSDATAISTAAPQQRYAKASAESAKANMRRQLERDGIKPAY